MMRPFVVKAQDVDLLLSCDGSECKQGANWDVPTMLNAFNCKFVAFCRPLEYSALFEFAALGLVRGINTETETLEIVSPVSPEEIVELEATSLVLGTEEVPMKRWMESDAGYATAVSEPFLVESAKAHGLVPSAKANRKNLKRFRLTRR